MENEPQPVEQDVHARLALEGLAYSIKSNQITPEAAKQMLREWFPDAQIDFDREVEGL